MQKQIKKNYVITLVVILTIGLFSIANNVKAAYEISDGSVKGLYHLEDTADSSGNGNNLTDPGLPTFGTALLSNGADFGVAGQTNNYLYKNSCIVTGNISLGIWVKLNAEIASGDYYFFHHNCVSNNISYSIDYQYNGGTRRLVFHRTRQGAGDDVVNYNVTMGTSTWHYLVLTYDGTTLKGWYDNSLAGSATSTGNGSSGGVDLLSINHSWSGNSGGEKADEAVLTNNVLSTSTISSLYNSGTGIEICTTAGCAATTSTSTSLSTSTDCFLGTDTTDWTLLYNIIMWTFYFLFTVIIVSLFWKWISKFKVFTK